MTPDVCVCGCVCGCAWMCVDVLGCVMCAANCGMSDARMRGCVDVWPCKCVGVCRGGVACRRVGV